MKKTMIVFLSLLLLLVGCAPKETDKEEIVQKGDEPVEQEVSIVPTHQLSKSNYRMILPFRPSEARGVIVSQVANRLDIGEMEEGLRRHSTDVFDPEKYYFEEGQYLTKDIVKEWIDDINPTIKDEESKKEHNQNPRYLSHVLEQNYLEKKDGDSVELVGVSIGLAMKSVYRYTTKPGDPFEYREISKKEMQEEGNKIAEEVVERLREMDELKDVPIMIGLYREEDQASPIPGNFIATTTVSEGKTKVGKWEPTKEEYVLFPSKQAKDNYYEDYDVVDNFGKDISDYFPNYVGYIGEGFYMDKELKKLSIEVPIEFNGAAEVVGFTQYAFGVAEGMFPKYYDLEIKIQSSDKLHSVIYREAGEEELTVHIFH